ncbi:MAG: hypothetical protein DME21_12115 [Verrucomicrobia bacterium]|nr:MAG: hypothetical protein DME21_12115 [Verrucomicrobiota bacterium]
MEGILSAYLSIVGAGIDAEQQNLLLLSQCGSPAPTPFFKDLDYRMQATNRLKMLPKEFLLWALVPFRGQAVLLF